MNTKVEPILYESHMHTPLCRHAVGEPEEYATRALERGLKGITVTCHGPTPYEWTHCMKQAEWPQYVEAVERARQACVGRVDVRLGIECDYLPQLEDYWREFLSNKPFSHVLGSVHPQVGTYRELFYKGHEVRYQQQYFEHLAMAAESGLFDTLSHPDLVKNQSPETWNVQEALPYIRTSLNRIAAAGVAMELNTSGLLKSVPEMNPGIEILHEMNQRHIPVVLGADAHVPDRVADKYEEAMQILSEVGYAKVSFFVNRQRNDVPIEQAKDSLTPVILDINMR